MIKYSLTPKLPASQYIKIEITIDVQGQASLQIRLPAWRPGRYELGNFVANIKDVDCRDAEGRKVSIKKLDRESWVIQPSASGKIQISYFYYAAALNAGSTYLSEEQLYVNPVNCLMYIPSRVDELCELKLQISEHWKVATALKEKEKHTFRARNIDELYDSPLIASSSLKNTYFEVAGIRFDVWFMGECRPDWNNLRRDLSALLREQLEFFRSFPTDRFHFLFQILPFKFRHGVEHIGSTVIAFGPGYALNYPDIYEDFLSICSHEVFHVWNVKTIRPADLYPYDFSKENFSELGYIYEGITTYYGELLGLRSGVLSEKFFLKEIQTWINNHLHNYGRKSCSVAQASFDTWIDGYREGAPHKKVSIYNEGALIALCLDFIIRRNSDGGSSLDDVMRRMNHEFGSLKKGYTREDFKKILEDYARENLDGFFERYIEGTDNYLDLLVMNVVVIEKMLLMESY